MSSSPSSAPKRSGRRSPLLSWLSVSAIDAIGRIGLQVVGTMLFARLLGPQHFGLSAITIVYVGAMSTIATSLFEEALVRRARVRKGHFRAALTAVLTLSTLLYSTILAVAAWAPFAKGGAAALALSLATVYGLTLFADAAQSIYVALARRTRRFGDLALANLLGLFGGTAIGLATAWLGGGVWALLAVPFVSRFLTLALLVLRTPVRLLPSTALSPAREMIRFGGFFMASRYVSSFTDVVMQSLVTRYFGVEGNGYLNMAMKIVEPLRGISGSISHNIATAYFAPLQAQSKRLSHAVQQTIAESALVLVPLFVGVAVTAPTILLVIAGPDWSASANIIVFLALASSLGSADTVLHTGLSARGRPDIWLASAVIELLTVAVAIVLLAPLGLVAAGLARLVASLAGAVFASLAARRVYGLAIGMVLRSLAAVSLCALLMSLPVLGVQSLDQDLEPILRLTLEVFTGATAYALAVCLTQRELLRSLRNRLWPPPAIR